MSTKSKAQPVDQVIDIQPVGMSANGGKPFVLQQIFKVEHCDLPGYEEFWIKARINLTNDERDALNAANDAVIAYSNEWTEQPEDERDQVDTPNRRQLDLIAPFIVDWNASSIDLVSGEPAFIPPPVVGGWASFEAIFPEMRTWCREATLNSYLSGKGLASFTRALGRLRARMSAGSDGDPS